MCMELPFFDNIRSAHDPDFSKQFILVLKCTKNVNLVIFPMPFIKYHVHKLLGCTHGLMVGHNVAPTVTKA